MLLVICCLFFENAKAQKIVIAKARKAQLGIVVATKSSSIQNFAAEELAKYLKQITGAKFTISQQQSLPAIKFILKQGKNEEAYSIAVQNQSILLIGNSDQAILSAVYGFLERLGCIWIAPDFEMYNGKAEVIPTTENLIYSGQQITTAPSFSYRTIDVDGGRTHNVENLKKMIDWMPKARYNTLRVPVNLNGNGRVSWDNWRDGLVPELKKRGLILELGGHGFQNFINAKMENGMLFKQHPEWFGKDSTCNYVASDRLVFNTENPMAVQYFIKNIVDYVKKHPEINIFGMWPPDVGRWQDCKEFAAYGLPQDRQAKLANQVDSALKSINPAIKTEIIAYSYTLSVPMKVKLNSTILVDYCPINQSFEYQIFDQTAKNNAEYVAELLKWRKEYAGPLGLYSYYRKYAWRSMPNVIPKYIQRDMKYYASVRLQGISTYAEPGDWFTYELNHYMLGQLAWNPNINVDTLSDQYFIARYGKGNLNVVKNIYSEFENTSPVYGSTPFSVLKSAEAIEKQMVRFDSEVKALQTAVQPSTETHEAANFSRLKLMCEYLKIDLRIQHLKAKNAPKEEVLEAIKTLVSFLQNNLNKGVFLLSGDNDLPRFTKKYGLTNQSLLD